MARKKKESDVNVNAFEILKAVTRESPSTKGAPSNEKIVIKNPAAVALGRLGGKKGGPARAKKLSPHRRKAIAKLAAETRWGVDR